MNAHKSTQIHLSKCNASLSLFIHMYCGSINPNISLIQILIVEAIQIKIKYVLILQFFSKN